jgi:hypothetical protein
VFLTSISKEQEPFFFKNNNKFGLVLSMKEEPLLERLHESHRSSMLQLLLACHGRWVQSTASRIAAPAAEEEQLTRHQNKVDQAYPESKRSYDWWDKMKLHPKSNLSAYWEKAMSVKGSSLTNRKRQVYCKESLHKNLPYPKGHTIHVGAIPILRNHSMMTTEIGGPQEMMELSAGCCNTQRANQKWSIIGSSQNKSDFTTVQKDILAGTHFMIGSFLFLKVG